MSSKIFEILYATADGFVQSPSAMSQQSHTSKTIVDTSKTTITTSQSLLNDDDDNNEDDDAPISPVKYNISESIEVPATITDNNDDDSNDGAPAPPDDEDDEAL